MSDERTVFDGSAECPYCARIIEITVKRKILEPGKKAMTKDHVEVKKSIQTTLSITEE